MGGQSFGKASCGATVRGTHEAGRWPDRELCEPAFVTSQGSSYSRFQRALKMANLSIIRSAAAELPQVGLGDALAVCVAIRDAEPHRFERAALRWLARFCVERRDATLADVTAAAWAFEHMAERPTAALHTLLRVAAGLPAKEQANQPQRTSAQKQRSKKAAVQSLGAQSTRPAPTPSSQVARSR